MSREVEHSGARGTVTLRCRLLEEQLLDPEARFRQPLRAAARAAARALGARSILELEAARDAARGLDAQTFVTVLQAATQLVDGVGQELLRNAELARQLRLRFRRGAGERLPQSLRQREVRFAIGRHGVSCRAERSTARGNA
jgi:hypothetical protein